LVVCSTTDRRSAGVTRANRSPLVDVVDVVDGFDAFEGIVVALAAERLAKACRTSLNTTTRMMNSSGGRCAVAALEGDVLIALLGLIRPTDGSVVHAADPDTNGRAAADPLGHLGAARLTNSHV
jgi:hypothetical protein